VSKSSKDTLFKIVSKILNPNLIKYCKPDNRYAFVNILFYSRVGVAYIVVDFIHLSRKIFQIVPGKVLLL
jgi:hypothetical protein